MKKSTGIVWLWWTLFTGGLGLHAATIVVNSAADPAGFDPNITVPGLGATVTLRDAVNAARNSGGTHTITFDAALAGQTILLSQIGDANGPSALAPAAHGIFRHITFQGLTGPAGITIARDPSAPNMRLFLCFGDQSRLVFNDLTFENGNVLPDNWGGGIQVVEMDDVTINRCTFKGNSAYFGGAVYNRSAIIRINNSTFTGNTASEQGGGIYAFLGQTYLNHVTMADNQAGGGGGLFCYTGTYPTLVNCLFDRNDGGNIQGSVFGGGSHHNLVGPGAYSNGGLVDGTNNNLVGRETHLGPLADHGGPTETYGFTGPSPAYDAGTAISGITTDQRGVARPQGPAPDVGAYEAEAEAPVITSTNSTGFITIRDNSFLFLSSGYPAPVYSYSGSLPAGVTLSSGGLLSGIPALGSEGSYPITVTASNGVLPNAVQAFDLNVAAGNLLVTTLVDENDGSPDPLLGTGLSLREAVLHANTQSTPQIILFAPSLAGQTIVLTNIAHTVAGNSALKIEKDITIRGPEGDGGGIILSRAVNSMRHFFINSSPGKLTLENLTLQDGVANEGGAVFNFGTFVARNCAFLNNYAGLTGGALNNVTGGGPPTATLINCTVANNSAHVNGGGIWTANSSPLTLSHVTITGNSVGLGDGGGVYGNHQVNNSIVAGNTKGANASDISGTATGTHNLIGTGGAGGLTDGVDGNQVGVAAPGLAPVGMYGGATPTRLVYRSSPARDAGIGGTGITTDQRGQPRPQGAAPDIGAYEYQPRYLVTTALDEDDDSSDPGVGSGTSLREALSDATVSGTAQTITFDPGLGGQTVVLTNGWNDAVDASALRISTPVTVEGLVYPPGITLAVTNTVSKRHFLVESSGNLTLSNLTLTGGRGDYGGAVWNFGALTVLNSTLTGNHAVNEGGAIQSWGESPLLRIGNSTLSGNSCDGVGAALNIGALQMELNHVTITSNSAPTVAVSIYQYTVNATNTLVAGNSVEGVGSVLGGAFSAASANNLLSTGGTAGLTNGVNGNWTGVPGNRLYLGPLTANDGPTPTHALLPGSPLINSGVATGLPTDQRGFPRVVAGVPDIGAVEDTTGDSDPDRDVLFNIEEALRRTNPLAIDSDNDGFNDGTEVNSGSDPALSGSVPGPTRIERVLGFGPARGLDLAGTFVYAFNVGSPGAAGTAGDAVFTADNAPGITVTAPNDVAAFSNPDLGNSPEADVLEAVFRSLRWTGHPGTLNVDLADLVPGQRYRLQLLFDEAPGYAQRTLDVRVEGTLVADDFRPYDAEGMGAPDYAASAVVHDFTATDNMLNIVLDGAEVPPGTSDRNPMLSGVTLEVLTLVSTQAVTLVELGFTPDVGYSGSFSNIANGAFTLYGTTNLVPPTVWSPLGPVPENPPGSGLYMFTAPANTNAPATFIRVQSP